MPDAQDVAASQSPSYTRPSWGGKPGREKRKKMLRPGNGTFGSPFSLKRRGRVVVLIGEVYT